jgi:hypothetical protein
MSADNVSRVLAGVERATAAQCTMCELHHHRETHQRGLIQALEEQYADQRAVSVENWKRGRRWRAAFILTAAAWACWILARIG